MNNINLKETLDNLGYNLLDRGDYWQTNALFRGGDNRTAIQIYKDTGVWKDHVNQTPFMPFKKLVQATLGSNDDEVIEGAIFKQDLFTDNVKLDNKPRISMEKTYNNSCLSRLLPHYSFYEDKGISIDILKLFKGGLCTEGKMYQRFVFPIYNTQLKIHGFSGRDMRPSSDRPKWKHVGTKTKWLYPHHLSEIHIEKSSEIILVESIGDVLSLYQNGIKNVICTFGTLISPSLISYIVKLNPKKIIFSFNNDSDNKNNAGLLGCIKSFFKLITYVDYEKIKIVLPVKNDFGDMDRIDFNKWEEKKESFSSNFDYNKIVDYALEMNSNQKQPQDFIKKIKNFKKQLEK